MTAKRKITLIAGAALLVALMAVLAVFSVWAASTRNLTSTINVTYTSSEISGSAAANYYVGPTYSATQFGNGGSVTFEADKDTDQTLSPTGEIKLGDTNQYVVFEYKFENDSDHIWYANLSTSGTATNVEVYFGSEATQIENDTIKSWSDLTGTGKPLTQKVETADGVTLTDVSVPAKSQDNNGVAYAYVAVKIKNLANKAEFDVTFTWNLKATKTGAGA